ncbi:hypothetical protein [Streptomyces tsukubensis]|uniref:hypothetical protein n=1 Tax=Streptomyces tsukubensis TaxID=83656 RepID=UPI00344FEF44
MTTIPAAGTTTVPAPGRPAGLRPRQTALLTAITTTGGCWSTVRVVRWRARQSGPQATLRGTARRDLYVLARHGHLTEHGPHDGRFYTLRSTT